LPQHEQVPMCNHSNAAVYSSLRLLVVLISDLLPQISVLARRVSVKEAVKTIDYTPAKQPAVATYPKFLLDPPPVATKTLANSLRRRQLPIIPDPSCSLWPSNPS